MRSPPTARSPRRHMAGMGNWNSPRAAPTPSCWTGGWASGCRDAGAVPAGHGSKARQVLDAALLATDEVRPGTGDVPADPSTGPSPSRSPGLIAWGPRRAWDTYDSVHRCGSPRKLRSLLKSRQVRPGPTTRGCSTSCASWPPSWAWPRRRGAADKLREDSPRRRPSWCAGRCAERLVDGAHRRYEPVCAARSPRCAPPTYFQFARRPGSPGDRRNRTGCQGGRTSPVTIGAACKLGTQGGQGPQPPPADAAAIRALPNPAKGAKRLPRRRPPARDGVRQDHSDAAG